MTANARIPIDLNDPNIPLTEGLKVLLEFTAEANQKHFLDPKRETIYVRDLVYVMLNGYLLTEGRGLDRQQQSEDSPGLDHVYAPQLVEKP